MRLLCLRCSCRSRLWIWCFLLCSSKSLLFLKEVRSIRWVFRGRWNLNQVNVFRVRGSFLWILNRKCLFVCSIRVRKILIEFDVLIVGRILLFWICFFLELVECLEGVWLSLCEVVQILNIFFLLSIFALKNCRWRWLCRMLLFFLRCIFRWILECRSLLLMWWIEVLTFFFKIFNIFKCLFLYLNLIFIINKFIY